MTVFTRSAAPLTAEVDSELVMLDPSTSNYFGLDGGCTPVQELCAGPQSVLSRYNVSVSVSLGPQLTPMSSMCTPGG
jgi:hypothetical protein